ncbi:DNA polymerase subunit gamma-1-like isoform X2 [Argiope bruennichi]|uniref:DNA polymerase subunit gamma-1-like isoform X2 n=1 Tax=Argiope bruennichi TaxID=94029 RepID=UPI002494DF9B|nr:DNA polymerase subunit gamma-1-like isoform X2 [Argiope bruennichi]
MAGSWMQYDKSGTSKSVDYPEESALVFDVEVCMKEGNFPTMATAVTKDYWYLWCSDRLTEDHFNWSQNVTLSDLIPLETTKHEIKFAKDKKWMPKIIVGHNVAFDRAFVKEQYYLERTKAQFLDTMSLHMCVSGLTGMQRAMSIASKKKSENDSNGFLSSAIGWTYISSLNNLADVYKLYCHGEIKKDEREIFVSGSLSDVKERFQESATYCAQDTWATFHILKKIMPMYLDRFPHPVTLCGLLEMASSYLPVNHNWEHYIHEAQSTYVDLQKELKLSLVHLANDACSLLPNNLYKKDPWLWDLNWSVQNIKFKKAVAKNAKTKQRKKSSNKSEELNDKNQDLGETPISEDTLNDGMKDMNLNDIDPSLKQMYETASSLRKIRPFLPGYPLWYRELCDKSAVDDPDWEPGPYLISTQMRSVPKLMRMTWDGFPLHYDEKHGWGYLVPDVKDLNISETNDFPLESLLRLVECTKIDATKAEQNIDSFWSIISEPSENKSEASKLWESILGKSRKQESWSLDQFSNGPHDVGIKGCQFYKLPHKDGPQKRVGNPLSKDFLSKVEDGTLKTWGKGQADRALLLSKMLSYWKNAHERIMSQMVVWLSNEELSETIKCNEAYDENGLYGAILPRLIPAGTVTRRAVEPTWLTASNAYEDRVGSELKAMIQAPPGYHFVGADVDSQELWLAAVFGDSQFVGIHGCTAFGWMTLQGKKSSGTDMHSKTAKSVGVSRDQAKILNYARIYGAGKSFTQRLLMQFNHRLTLEEAKKKVKKIYAETKGIQKFVEGDDEVEDSGFIFTPNEERRIWTGGSESFMFNKLEDIALSPKPRTPALGCRISRALEPKAVDKNFMTSRINWVVQSSAVDFLHLMLVCMKWLFTEFNIQGRFSISIHDEVRYLVKSEDRYRAALALQITNLLTRSFFTSKLGMYDLPQSVAFFSSVDVDTVLRKEVHMDSVTPSNPHGLEKGYGIAPGEALDIHEILQKTNGGQLSKKTAE